jgi:hypothetical protein
MRRSIMAFLFATGLVLALSATAFADNIPGGW